MFPFISSTSFNFHTHIFIHNYIQGFKLIWLFFITMVNCALLGSILINISATKNNIPLLYVLSGSLSTSTDGFIVYGHYSTCFFSKRWHCNNMQLLHRDISINLRKSFCHYFYRDSLHTSKQDFVCQLALKDWGPHKYPANTWPFITVIDLYIYNIKMSCVSWLLIPECPSFS